MIQHHPQQSIQAHRDWLISTVEQWGVSRSGRCQSADIALEQRRSIQFANGQALVLGAPQNLDFAEFVVFAPVTVAPTSNWNAYLYSLPILCSVAPDFSRARFDEDHQLFYKSVRLPLVDGQALEHMAIPQMERALWYVAEMAAYLTELTLSGCLSSVFGKTLRQRFLSEIQTRWGCSASSALSN